jgi:hypothetical protein
MTTQQQRILDAIPYGQEHAIKNHALAVRTGLSDREVQEVIQSIINDQLALICSSTHDRMGYYRPLNWKEAQSYLCQLISRESRLHERTLAVKRMMREQFTPEWEEQKEMGAVG